MAAVTSSLLQTRVVALPNDADRVSDAMLELSTVPQALYLRHTRDHDGAACRTKAGAGGGGGMTTSRGSTLCSSSFFFRRQRIVAVFHMGETTQPAGEEMSALAAALVELSSCRIRFGRFCIYSAIVVVRSPWYASVLLSALSVPPLHGALLPRVFESGVGGGSGQEGTLSSSSTANDAAIFPKMLMMALRHFPFCVMSEDLFRSACVSWNCAHRLQDLIHALHHVIRLHLFHFPDLESEENQSNIAAVREMLAFSGGAGRDVGGDDASAKARTKNSTRHHSAKHSSKISCSPISATTETSLVPSSSVANSFVTLYYEVLVRRNVMILSSGQSTTRERERLIQKLVPLLPKLCSVTGGALARRRARGGGGGGGGGGGAHSAIGIRLSGLCPSSSTSSSERQRQGGEEGQHVQQQENNVHNDDDDDDDDDEGDDRVNADDVLHFSLPEFQLQLLQKLEQDQKFQELRLLHPSRRARREGRKDRNKIDDDDTENDDEQCDVDADVDVDDGREKQLDAPDAMVFPAVSISAVATFLEHPSNFDDENAHDVARLMCVLYRHFRNGISISQLQKTLKNRRRTILAVHEACAAGLLSVRLDSGIVKVI